MPDRPTRIAFLNSGILGHRTVGALFQDVAARLPRVDAVHIDLSSELSWADRAARRLARLERERGRFALLNFHTQAAAYASLNRMRHTPAVVSIDCTQGLASNEAESAVSRSTYLANMIRDAFVFRRASLITATSRWAADDLLTRYSTCRGKVGQGGAMRVAAAAPAAYAARFQSLVDSVLESHGRHAA